MDILTPLGKKSREDEIRAVEIFNKHYPDFKYLETPKDSPAIIDALLVRDGIIHCAVETKCRDMSLEDFQGKFKHSWLVTHEKIEGARNVAMSLGVGLTGFLYLKKSDVLLVAPISNKEGLYKRVLRIEATQTQRTINGGLAIRNNSYIDMSDAVILNWD